MFSCFIVVATEIGTIAKIFSANKFLLAKIFRQAVSTKKMLIQNSKTKFFYQNKQCHTNVVHPILASLALTIISSEGAENKINSRDVSGLRKSFLKKGKNAVNGKIFFVSLMSVIVNIIASIFVSSYYPRTFCAFIYPLFY